MRFYVLVCSSSELLGTRIDDGWSGSQDGSKIVVKPPSEPSWMDRVGRVIRVHGAPVCMWIRVRCGYGVISRIRLKSEVWLGSTVGVGRFRVGCGRDRQWGLVGLV